MLNRGSSPAEEFVPKDASLLETETWALKVHPFAMMSLLVVSLMVATSMTVERWMVVWLMDLPWMDSVRLWAQMVHPQVRVSLLLVFLHVKTLTVFDMSSVDLLAPLNRLELTPTLHLKGNLHVTHHH